MPWITSICMDLVDQGKAWKVKSDRSYYVQEVLSRTVTLGPTVYEQECHDIVIKCDLNRMEVYTINVDKLQLDVDKKRKKEVIMALAEWKKWHLQQVPGWLAIANHRGAVVK